LGVDDVNVGDDGDDGDDGDVGDDGDDSDDDTGNFNGDGTIRCFDKLLLYHGS
jgi:hypothetical protein